MQDYFDEVMRTNQQWNAPENPSTAGWIGGALGSGAGSMAVLAPALATDALTTKMPIATSAAVFGQSFGENLQRNRATYGPENEGKSVGLAAAESAVDTAIELALGTVPLVGKAMKGLGRGGKRELVKAMYREAEKDLGRSGAKRFFIEMGKNSGEEGLEEALQYTNTWMWRAIGGDKANKFELKEVLDAAGQGAVGAIPFGAADGVQSVRQNAAERPWLARAQAMRTGKETASPRGGYYDKEGNYHAPAPKAEPKRAAKKEADVEMTAGVPAETAVSAAEPELTVPETNPEIRVKDEERTLMEKLFDE